MKRGRDGERITGPMFPRLHVNDTEKGGPRAPPRNKMALYEQLSIPTQRFNTGVSNISSLVRPGSSSQGSFPERNSRLTYPISPSPPTHFGENIHSHDPAGPLPHHEQSKKVGDEGDFAVPIVVQAGMRKTRNDNDLENPSPSNPSCTSQSKLFQNACSKNPKCNSSNGLSLRQEGRHQGQEDPNICISSRDRPSKSCVNLSSGQEINGLVKDVRTSPDRECRDIPGSNFSRFNDRDASVRRESGADFPSYSCHRDEAVESIRDIQKGVILHLSSDTRSREDCSIPNGFDNESIPNGFDNESIPNEFGNDSNVSKTRESLQSGSGDKNDDFSETSMVDSLLCVDISPDDIVGIIGQKHFWKARRAIVNQQRVFAVQVFELHRLIKVQQLIAKSPNVLLEERAYIGKASSKASPAKKRPVEYVGKPLPHIVKRKDNSEKLDHKIECSAENAIGKTSVSSVKNGSQPSIYGSYLPNQPSSIVAADSRMSPWCFDQSPGHQWLIPVMSPSEGLIYKPYPGPGFMGTGWGGGCSPLGPTHLTGNFMHPAYGIPSSIPHQGNVVMPGADPLGHCYIPPLGMPNMNPSMAGSAAERKNQFTESGSHGQHSQFFQGGDDFGTQQESSCNIPAQDNGAIPQVRQLRVTKDTELQGSSCSSPGERGHGDMSHASAEGTETLQLFTASPVVPEATPQPHDADQASKVIKVVPHNPRSATESAARIFQSIQEERKQYDSD